MPASAGVAVLLGPVLRAIAPPTTGIEGDEVITSSNVGGEGGGEGGREACSRATRPTCRRRFRQVRRIRLAEWRWRNVAAWERANQGTERLVPVAGWWSESPPTPVSLERRMTTKR